jgi:hypothetical protein
MVYNKQINTDSIFAFSISDLAKNIFSNMVNKFNIVFMEFGPNSNASKRDHQEQAGILSVANP